MVRFSYPALPAIYAQERQLIDQIRASRNRAQYDAGGEVDASLAERATALAARALGSVQAVWGSPITFGCTTGRTGGPQAYPSNVARPSPRMATALGGRKVT